MTDSIFQRTLETTLRHALAYLRNLDTAPVGCGVDLKTLRGRLGRALSDQGEAPDKVIEELVRDVEGASWDLPAGGFSGG